MESDSPHLPFPALQARKPDYTHLLIEVIQRLEKHPQAAPEAPCFRGPEVTASRESTVLSIYTEQLQWHS